MLYSEALDQRSHLHICRRSPDMHIVLFLMTQLILFKVCVSILKETTIVLLDVMNQINLAWDLTMMITSDLPLDKAFEISPFKLNWMRLTFLHQLTWSITDTLRAVINSLISGSSSKLLCVQKLSLKKITFLTCLNHCLQHCMQTPWRCIGTPLYSLC